MNAHVKPARDNERRLLTDAPHDADWHGDRWLAQRGYEQRVCKLCEQTEDVHVAAAL